MSERISNDQDPKYYKQFYHVGVRLLISTSFYPIEYAKTLIQIGFEPVPPRMTTTIFGKPALGLPSVFSYVKYIYSVDGITGCFNGLTPRLFNVLLTTVAHDYIIDKYKIPEEEVEEEGLGHTESQLRFIKILARDLLATSSAIIISQPFHVITVRKIGQFVGRETKYSGVFSSLYTVYKEEYVSGWFSGLLPRLVGEVATVFLVSTITFAVNSYLTSNDTNIHHLLGIGIDFFVKNLTYPLHVIDVCLAINSSGLKAGSEPHMPNYESSSIKCWQDLSNNKQLKRGSALLWRYTPIANANNVRNVLVPLPEIPKEK
ncbi:mitochondrial carrier homolog 2-like [Lycorma delicatula]|uniref:mitochondrial carrier homolog 2-like n=1 Tax=Lycorma delicatula TaxID=130591 RepID=UPI003F5185D3